ncbi:MSHA biogenesis protein MshJ [Marinobacter pelagius]|uniref:MSHA biogenesis protein MshJ n=1 Tax=Marinobacter pelagius TaxID=379482 RepID=A0A366G0T2_9GAMM|nr:MSHA biogenesis protein MshJ [Marinobacter pelagius]RBP20564.1 MSHA biogenesis protein MshJ [Marinobacter pelagius]
MSDARQSGLAGLGDWFNDRPARERVLLLVTGLVVVLFAGWELALAPVSQEIRSLESRRVLAETRQTDLLTRQQELEQILAQDPSAELRQRLEQRQSRLDQLDQQVAETADQLIAPRAMVALLREILAAQDNLTLLALELKTPEPVYADSGSGTGEAGGKQPEPLLFAHSVELRVQGGYLDVLAYLERLEAMDDRLGWVRLSYDATSWPAGEAVIEVRTLSLEKAWLGV